MRYFDAHTHWLDKNRSFKRCTTMTGDTLRVGRALIFLEPDRCPSAHRRDNYRKSRAIRLGNNYQSFAKTPRQSCLLQSGRVGKKRRNRCNFVIAVSCKPGDPFYF